MNVHQNPTDLEDKWADPETAIEYTAFCLSGDVEKLADALADPSMSRHVLKQRDEIHEAFQDLARLVAAIEGAN